MIKIKPLALGFLWMLIAIIAGKLAQSQFGWENVEAKVLGFVLVWVLCDLEDERERLASLRSKVQAFADVRARR